MGGFYQTALYEVNPCGTSPSGRGLLRVYSDPFVSLTGRKS